IAPVYVALHAASPVKRDAADWRVWVAGFFAVEFAYYWMHRWSHTVRWLWTSHSVHHSAAEFTLPAAIRLGWTNVFSGAWLVFAPLMLLGFPPLVVVVLLAANLKYQFLLHTELVGKLGPLEWILNTPSYHRVHHASNPVYLDRNFGGVLIVFDRLFGTFAAERNEEKIVYGLVEPLRSNNPFAIALHEWGRMGRDALRARDAGEIWTALFGRPGAIAKRRATDRTALQPMFHRQRSLAP
ncbi:MAG: sterol desaturase family protein, partial [Parvularculaceae bacterium]|nr:sterol desaturase family protein [Parvularculaceae bacterium]